MTALLADRGYGAAPRRRFRIVRHELRLIGTCADCDRAGPRTRAGRRP
jgi:hypothetical protein